MRIYVAGPVADTVTVQQVQDAVIAAGHELTLDWSADVSLAQGFGSQIKRSARMAEEELDAVIAADAVLVSVNTYLETARLAPWGNGYATEGSRDVLGKAFTELGVRLVWAETLSVNRGSRNVSEKVSMTLVDTIPGP